MARQLLDNREFVLVEGRHPSSDPNHGRDDAGYDSEEEERDLHHQDMYMSRRGGGTVHPAIPDRRRTYGSVYARFDAGFTFRFRWVRVRFSWDPYRTSTDFRIRTGFRTQVE